MKTIGVIAGLSWESSVIYYQVLNTTVKERLGGLHSARCIFHSVDFQPVEACMAKGDWDGVAEIVCGAAVSLERAGAEFFLLATNTIHKVADRLRASVGIPFLHIAEATADALSEKGIRVVGLLGTKYTMEGAFYRDILEARGFKVLTPDAPARERLNEIIFSQLCVGDFRPESKRYLLDCVEALKAAGAEAGVLGCTELPLLAREDEGAIPLFNTALIHARRAAFMALGGEGGE